MRKIIYTVLIIFSIFSIMLNPVAFASEVVAVGEASTIEAAVHKAMRNAIEYEVGLLVDSRTLTHNQQIIKDDVILNSMGFVAGHEVLSQSQNAGIFSVKVKVKILSEELKTSLMSALEKDALVETNLNDPRIAIIATDELGTEYPEIENEIITALQNQGFSRLITKAENADYVINVNVKTGMANSIHTANLAVRMVNKIGEVVYSGSFDGRSRMFTNNSRAGALKSATNRAAVGIAQAALNLAAKLEQHVTITASSLTLDKCGGLDSLRIRLLSIVGISNVFIRSLSGGTAELDVDYDGTASELAIELKHAGFKILEISSNYISI